MRVLIPVILGGSCAVAFVALASAPSTRVLAVAALAMLLCSLMWVYHEATAKRDRVEREKFLAGLCPFCGYDVRAAEGACPECGAPAWTPERPLGWPDKMWPGSRLMKCVPLREVFGLMLARRGPTPPTAWGDDAHVWAVAALVVRACQPTNPGEPYGAFRPCDSFALVSSATTVDQFAAALEAELGLTMTAADLLPYEAMTLGEVANDLAARATAAFPTAAWSPPPRPDQVTFVRPIPAPGAAPDV